MLTSTNTSSGTNSAINQKIVSSVKKQSPATKYDREREKEAMLKDDKKIKVKVLQKKIG